MSHSGSNAVYTLLKDKVVWHDIGRDGKDVPSGSFPVIIEGFCYSGMGRLTNDGWRDEDTDYCIKSVSRWAIVPDEIWTAYFNGYFDRFDKRRKFQSKEEFVTFAEKAKHISGKELPTHAEEIGYFHEERPYESYDAAIYFANNQFFLCDGCKEWALD